MQDVDPAMGRGDACHERGDGLRIRDIAGMGRGAPAFSGDDLGRLVGRCLADVHAGDLSAFAREQRGGRLAIAPARADGAGAEDDRDLVLDASRHLASPPTA
jgi:hypothetical protein